MKKIWSKSGKRFAAFLLIICMIMGNFNVTTVAVLAEESDENMYTFVCKATIKEVEQIISDVNVTIYDADNNEIQKTNNAYELKSGKKYKYKVTSSKFSEVNDEFTAGTDKEIIIKILLNKLNITMEDKNCYVGERIPMFKENDWDLDWTWSSSDPKVATVDDKGNVTAIKKGTTIIKKVSKLDDTIQKSAQITVQNQYVKCNLKYITNEATAYEEELSGLAVTIKDENDKIITADESENYSLLPDKEYKYEITDTGITEKSKKGTFQTPSYIDNNVKEIKIPLELTEPVFTINGIPIEEVGKVKKGSTITVKCTNYNDLYQKENWKYKVNSGIEVELDQESTITCSKKLQIEYTYEKKTQTKSVEIFEKYEFFTSYDEVEVTPKVTFIIKDAEENVIQQKNMEAGVSYDIYVSAIGFKENKVAVTPSFNQSTIYVPLGEIIEPTLKEAEGYCGGSIPLKEVVTTEYYKLWDWDWTCVSNDDSSINLPIKNDEIDLKNAKEGSYTLTCSYKDIKSNSVTVTVKKIKLDVNWNEWIGKEKQYDASKKFTIEMPIKEETSITFVEGEKTSYYIDNKDTLVITGELASADVGEYDRLYNVEIEIEGSKEKYDLSLIENVLTNKTLQFNSKKLKIKRVDREIVSYNLYLEYRTYNPVIPGQRITYNPYIEERDILTKELCRLMGKTTSRDDIKHQCTFEDVKYDEAIKKAYVENPNIKFTFNDIIPDEETKKLLFTYDYTPETLYLNNTTGVFSLNQDGTSLSNKKWCNTKPITATLETNDSPYYGDNAYNKITFYKLQGINEWKDLSEDSLKKGEVNGTDQLNIKSLEKETYYEVVFTRDEANWQYATPAAIIRIIPESQYDADEVYPASLAGSDGSYPVINLFFDETSPEVTFLDTDLNRKKKSECIKGGEKSIDQIEFSVDSTGFDVASIQYGFCNLDSTKVKTKEEDLLVPDLKDLKLESSKTYTVKCPDKEGDYALYVQVTDEGGNTDAYISNGFFIDRTEPKITPELVETDGNKKDLTEAVKNNEEVYTKQNIHAKFTLKEAHLDPSTVNVTITATELGEDGTWQSISSLDSYVSQKAEEIKNALSGDRIEEQTAECDFTENANYTVEIKAKDKAGFSRSVTYRFTVDNENPDKGSVSVVRNFHKIKTDDGREKGKIELIFESIQDMWDKLLDTIVYNIFSQEEVKVTLTGTDRISPVEIYYYITTDTLTEAQLKDLREEDWVLYSSEKNKQPKITMNRQEILYERVLDKAGNVSYFCTEGIITDNKAPEIDLTVEKKANKNNFYNSDVPFSACIEDKIADGGTGSTGLQYVAYRIEKEGSISESKVIYDAGENKKSDKKECHISKSVIDAEKFNNNDVALYVTAVDNAGNKKEIKEKLQIDTVKPEISVTYDDEPGAQYYNHARTATITIKERNLDTDDIDVTVKSNHGSSVSMGKWTHSSNIGKSDEATYTCKVTFSKDDDYEFAVNCVDKAGNKAVKSFTDKFTIDTEKPVISVSYSKGTPEQNIYYNEPITATITITEHNFDAGKVNIQTDGGESDGGGVSGAAGFSSNGDIHTATIQYDTDGTYGLSVSYTDEAGNQADSFTGDNFTIDLIKPELKITNLENQSANKGAVQPVITCTDTNYEGEKVSITVTGFNNGEMDLNALGYAVNDIANGQQFEMDFPKTEELDDVYTLTAKVTDKAGNETESSIDFSVNCYGSVYTLETETGKWLTSGECAYIKEGKPIVILETNVDEITDRSISYMTGGMNAATVNIKEEDECSSEEKENGTYFKVTRENTEGQWHQCRYEINANNFKEEGRYTIQIDSTDKAGNHTSNVSNKHSNSNLDIEFAIDKTAPSVVVTGTDNGQVFNEETHTLLLDVQDNLELDYVTVYLNGEEYGTYSTQDIKQMENGYIPVKVEQSLSTQIIQVEAKDMAGNILGEDANGTYDKTFENFRVIVTRNPFIRFIHTTWLLIMVLLVIAGGIGAAVIVVIRKKKKN